MNPISALEELTTKGILSTVLVECEAGPGGKMWEVVLSDNHGRKGRGISAEYLDTAIVVALRELNGRCGNQLRRYL